LQAAECQSTILVSLGFMAAEWPFPGFKPIGTPFLIKTKWIKATAPHFLLDCTFINSLRSL
jgi:hypothetical protein